MISVIIPTYNVEDYVHICLNSVLKQSYGNFEIICIDDASTDSTIEILEYYQRKDSRIKILKNNENSGPGYSRNRGLDEAKGKYIFFLDSDDWLSYNTFELLYSKSEELYLDLLIYKAIVYYNNDAIFGDENYYNMNHLHKFENKVFTFYNEKSLLLSDIVASTPLKLYKKSFLDKNNIRFPNERLIQEDEAFCLDVLLTAKRVSFLNMYLYNRRRRDNSIMTLNGKRLLDNLKIADIMINSCLNYSDVYELRKKELLNYIFNILSAKYYLIDDEFKSIFFNSTKEFFNKCYEEYNLKEDILENVDKNILIKFEQINNDYDDIKENKDLSKYLTIDVGGTNIKYSLMDKNREIFKKDIIKSNTEENDLYLSLDEIISHYLDQINGIAISLPGVINVDEGIAHTGGAFRWISDLPLKSILEKKYDKKVWIENDGKCAALAEFWKGNLKDVKNGVTIGLGTGIAGGIILNGELYRGIDGSSAEFSSILGNYDDPINSKRLSEIGAYKGLIVPYAELKGLNDIDVLKFFKDYHNGDKDAIKVLNNYSKIVATAIINIQVILNVEKFCIGGGISSQDVLINEISNVVHDYFENKASKAIKKPIIEKCYFENDAGCVGALYNFLKMENKI